MRTPPLLLILMLAACPDTADDDNPGAKVGEFGVGVFRYRCTAPGDPLCLDGVSTAQDFPEALARGSQIDLEFSWQDDEDHRNEPLPELQSATSDRLRDDGARFTALEPGFVAVIAVTGNSQVVELVHFEIAEIDELRAVPSPVTDFPAPLAQLDLVTGEERALQGLVVDIHDVQLGGIIPYSWASEDPTVLEVVSGGSTGRVRVRAVISGATNLVLTQGERTLTLPVLVEPGDAFTTGDPTSDGSSDGSSGSSGSTTADTGTTDDTDSDTSGGSSGTSGGAL
ncbi:MAG: hypothetical protein H0T76_06735 [Nannocystis sp.]|nr:hypothetical protein [Nannocystis sp.]MBA3546158.1 hypothetical protein [Nannocystis sp.]